MKKFLILLALCGCTPQQGYVEADRATFDVVAPEYLRYVEADATLSEDARENRQLLIDSWRIRVEKAEGSQ